MMTARKGNIDLFETTRCPYCNEWTRITPSPDYEPVYATCENCFQKFIIERELDGIAAYTLEAAPCCSDPEWRAIEMAQGDEE